MCKEVIPGKRSATRNPGKDLIFFRSVRGQTLSKCPVRILRVNFLQKWKKIKKSGTQEIRKFLFLPL